MYKRIVTLLISFLLLVSFSFVAVAEDKKKVRVRHINGDVVAYDALVRVMMVKSKKTEAEITLDDKTVITLNKDKKTPNDIKVGDYVHVKYIVSDGKNIAKRIQIKTDTKTK
ncbi:MAG: DUF5666 domain-containing protein [Thermodesulfovibrionales bacterium]